MSAVDVILRIALACALMYLVIQAAIVVLVVYKHYQERQIDKSLDRFRAKVKSDPKWDKK